MSRLGDLLLTAGLLSHEQLEQALRAQVVWGGRLGTNLIELGCLDLDSLAQVLGKQHGLPPALGRHFDRADPVIQDDLPAEIAAKYCVVPLLRFGTPPRIAVVSLDPLTTDARDEIAEAFGLESDQIVPSIAAEMRVRYHLERVYGIKRSARFLRSRGKTIPPFPLFNPNEMPFDIEEPTSPVVVPEQPAPAGLAAEADDISAMIDAAIDHATAPPEPVGRERRSYIKLIAEETSGPKDTQPLGRIPIRRVAVTSPPARPRSTTASKQPSTLADATRAIRRAAHRDRAADLIVDTLHRFAPACEAAMLLVIRGDAAIAWKHFSREEGRTPPELAVPMDQPGLCPVAVEDGCTARAPADVLSAIDLLLLRALGRMDGDLVVVPIPIAGKVMCLIAAVTEPGGEIGPIEATAAAGATAFARLIRDASR